MKFQIRQLKPSLWPDVEKLFGENGACGGCWCMWWRHPKGEKWNDVKGATNKRRFKRLVGAGKAHGALAYHEGEPVGWVSFEKRLELPRLNRSPSLKCDDAEAVWSIPCFYIHRDWRKQGIASQLLRQAVKFLRRRGARIVEGYPVSSKYGKKIPAAFAYTGIVPMFANAGFHPTDKRKTWRQRMRKNI